MPELKTMTVREHLRGGYREVTSPTIVMNGGEVAGIWSPGLTGINITYPTVDVADLPERVRASVNGASPAEASTVEVSIPEGVREERPAGKSKRSAAPRRGKFPDLTRRA